MGDRIPVKARAPGTRGLAATAHDRGYLSPRGPLASLLAEGERLPMGLPTVLPTPPLPTIRDDELTGSRTLARSAMRPEQPPAADLRESAFPIDGRRFDHDWVDQPVELGAVDAWTFVNDTTPTTLSTSTPTRSVWFASTAGR